MSLDEVHHHSRDWRRFLVLVNVDFRKLVTFPHKEPLLHCHVRVRQVNHQPGWIRQCLQRRRNRSARDNLDGGPGLVVNDFYVLYRGRRLSRRGRSRCRNRWPRCGRSRWDGTLWGLTCWNLRRRRCAGHGGNWNLCRSRSRFLSLLGRRSAPCDVFLNDLSICRGRTRLTLRFLRRI
jgi:hypothetical protein